MDYLQANKAEAVKNGIIQEEDFVVADLNDWDYKTNKGKAIG